MSVYFAQTPSGAVKVGCSWNPYYRMGNLKHAGERPELLWFLECDTAAEDRALERRLHRVLPNAIAGANEWYLSLPDDVLDLVMREWTAMQSQHRAWRMGTALAAASKLREDERDEFLRSLASGWPERLDSRGEHLPTSEVA